MATNDRNGNLGSAVADSFDGSQSWGLNDRTSLSLLFGDARPRHAPEEVTQPMELQRYARIVKSRKWVVILTTIITLAVVTLGSS